MKRLLTAALALGLASGVATAQAPPRDFSFVAMPSGTSGQSLLRLLRRAEVVTSMGLTLYQQKAIKDLADNPATGRIQVSITSTGGNFDPEQAKRDAEKQVADQQKGVSEKIKDILKPAQWDRIHELAIQWRGPLSLADSKVAEAAKISGPHRQQISRLSAEYQQQKMQVLMELAETEESGDPGSGQIRRAVRIDAGKLNKTGTPAYNKMNALKKAVDDKIMELLSDEEKRAFAKIQGEPFTFRKEPVGDRF